MARRDPPAILVSCEHAGREVPPELASLFRGQAALLRSHRGWDVGALAVAEEVASALGAPLMQSRVTRLVVDLNRTWPNRNLLSRFTRRLPPEERELVLERYYRPYVRAVEDTVDAYLAAGRRVLHVSVHSFTPELDGRVRELEAGLLFDPRRARERALAEGLRTAVRERRPDWRVRFNRPYHGASDARITATRKRFPASRYVAIELETRQDLLATAARRRRAGRLWTAALRAAVPL